MCSALRTVHDGRCGSFVRRVTGSLFAGVPPSGADVLRTNRFFSLDRHGLGDAIHPTIEHSTLQGCLAAKLLSPLLPQVKPVRVGEPIARQEGEPIARRGEPIARDRRGAGTAPHAHARKGAEPAKQHSKPWCVTARSTAAQEWRTAIELARLCAPPAALRADSGGWQLAIGGRGGEKEWAEPTRDGASLQLLLPASSPRLLLEHYAHDSKPMGDAKVRVAIVAYDGAPGARDVSHAMEHSCVPLLELNETTQWLRSACQSCPSGQGFYQMVEVAADLHIALEEARLRAARWLQPGSSHPPQHAPQLGLLLTVTAVARADGAFAFSLVSVIGAE